MESDTAQGIQNPNNDGMWNPSSTDKESRIQYLDPGIYIKWNSESKIIILVVIFDVRDSNLCLRLTIVWQWLCHFQAYPSSTRHSSGKSRARTTLQQWFIMKVPLIFPLMVLCLVKLLGGFHAHATTTLRIIQVGDFARGSFS